MFQSSFSKFTKCLVSALMVMSVVFFVGCSKDDDKKDDNNSNNNNSNSQTGNLVIESALQGTWVGEGTTYNGSPCGTLVISASAITTKDASGTGAFDVARNTTQLFEQGIGTSDGKIMGKTYNVVMETGYTYVIANGTLKITDSNGRTAFVGKKQ